MVALAMTGDKVADKVTLVVGLVVLAGIKTVSTDNAGAAVITTAEDALVK
jgi:hypothetical protein